MGVGTEDWTVEFIDSMDQLDEGLKNMTAMLNRFNKASIFIGVDKNGNILENDLSEDDVKAIRKRMNEMVRTSPDVNISLETSDGRRFIRITATGYETPYSFGSWFYTRKCNPTQPEGPSGPVVNEWCATITCGMKRHRCIPDHLSVFLLLFRFSYPS